MGQRYGQHFLVRGSVLERIARAACPQPVPLAIEIGPGKGALTTHLLDRAERVIAIEVDTVLVHYLQHKFREQPKLEIVTGDVLKTGLGAWGAAAIAGNLPYYITSPILDRVFALGEHWQRAVFLVQKEVAQRITAAPGSRDYGYLSVRCQVEAECELLFDVPPAAFQPPPKVDSAVVRLTRRAAPVEDVAAFVQFAGVCFKQKRKNLRNNLAAVYPLAKVDALPEAKLRAEQIPLDQLISLWRRLS